MKSYHASCVLSESQASCTQGIMRTLCLSGQRSNWCNLSVAFSPFPSSAKAQDRRRSEWFRRTCVTKCSMWRDFDRTKTDKVHKAPEASSQKAAGRYASMKIMESRYMSNLLDPRHLAHHILRLLLCYRLLLPGLFSPKGLDIRGQARQLQSPVANLLPGVDDSGSGQLNQNLLRGCEWFVSEWSWCGGSLVTPSHCLHDQTPFCI